MTKISLIFLTSLVITLSRADADDLSYSGRLVNTDSSPVTGPVDLRFHISYSGTPATVLCTKDVTSVPLNHGVFHVSLDFDSSDCSPAKPFVDILNDLPSSESVLVQITDVTNSRTYPHQALKSVPFSIQANIAKNIYTTTAPTEGQVLKWVSGKWTPSAAGGSGSITEIQTGSGLVGGPITSSGTISIASGGVTTSHIADSTITDTDVSTTAGIGRHKIASGTANHVLINNGSGAFSSVAQLPLALGGTGAANANDARLNLGLGDAATRNVGLNNGNILLADEVPSCLAHQKIQKTALAPYIFSCADDNDSADASKLPLLGGTMLGAINMGGFAITNLVDPTNAQDAATRNYVHTYVASELLGVSESQWINSGSDIYFSAGNVGIGKSTPSKLLDVNGDILVNGVTIGRGGGNDSLNTAIGFNTLNSNTANYNSAFGYMASAANTSGSSNTSVGFGALGGITVGSYNTALGRDSGGYIADGVTANQTSSNSIYIGSFAKALVNGATNEIVIGYNTIGNGSNSATLGNDLITKTILKGNVGIGANNPGAKLEVAGQVKITGGSPGAGKVLTSDGAGLATWESPAAGGISALTGDVTASGSGSVAATIANNAITSAKILDGTIVDADIANSSITYSKLNIADGSIPIAKLIRMTCLPGEVITSDAALGFRCIADNSTDSTKVPLAGGTMTGPLTLSGDPSANLHSATKQYVDARATQWTTSGSNIYYNTAGNVGIGTVTPGYKLDVNGTVRATAFQGDGSGLTGVLASAAGSNGNFQYNNGGILGATGNLNYNSSTNSIEVMNYLRFVNGLSGTTLTDGFHIALQGTQAELTNREGDLTFFPSGIGAMYVSPSKVSFHASSSTTNLDTNDRGIVIHNGYGAAGFDAVARFTTSSSGQGVADGFDIGMAESGSVAFFNQREASAMTFATTATERMRISATGNVGIGTSSPADKLHLESSGDINMIVSTTNAANSAQIEFRRAADTSWFGPTPSSFDIWYGESNPILFGIDGNERMRINASGNVGIGTANPTAKLHVAGQVRITGGAPGAGKVLTSDGSGLATWQTPSAGGMTALTGDVTASGSGSVAATIANNAITSAKILDGTIVNEDIANGIITYGKLNLADEILPIAKLARLNCSAGQVLTSDAFVGYRCVNDSTTDATKLPLAGGTMTGNLTLAGAPTANLHAATKQYVDSTISSAGSKWTELSGNIYRTSGRVGIGIASTPDAILHVDAGSRPTGFSGGGDIILHTGWDGTAANRGKVSIGPGAFQGDPYDLNLTTSGNSYSYQMGVPNSPGAGVSLEILAGGAGSNSSHWSGGNLTISGGQTYGGSASSNIFFKTAGGGTLGTLVAPSTKMMISGSGNVGIGTTSPDTTLHVAGQIKITGGSPGAGKVLTSDGSGLATWQTPAAAGATESVGIGSGTMVWFGIMGNYIDVIRSDLAGACGSLSVTGTLAGKTHTLTMASVTSTCTLPGTIDSLPVKVPASCAGGATVAGVLYTFLNDGQRVWVDCVKY